MKDQVYYERRAEHQLRMAQLATDPAACRSHFELANLYLERAGNPRDGRQAQPG